VSEGKIDHCGVGILVLTSLSPISGGPPDRNCKNGQIEATEFERYAVAALHQGAPGQMT